jgi:D-inositol-3-phosphate glycosyltransferase
MKIAMVSEHASPLAALGDADAGGQNVHVAELSKALSRQGHDVTVYTRRDSTRLPSSVRTPDGYRVVAVPAGPPVKIPKDELPPHMPEFARYLSTQWSAQPPDLVHAHFWMSGQAALDASDGIPVVQTFHALGSVKKRHQREADTSPPQRVEVERRIASRADRVIATCSDEVFELARLGMPRARASVVPCGVNLDEFGLRGPVASRGCPHRIVSVGRLVPRKGFDIAVRALPELPDTELVIAGGPDGDLDSDPEARRLRSLADELGVGDRLRMTGQVAHEEIPPLLRSADVVVCTPWYEPFGITPLEAMACGVPVVASAVGGLTDTVLDDVTGKLVEPRDPVALARGVLPVLRDPAVRERLGEAGYRRVRGRYSWERIAQETVRAYGRVCSGSGVGALAQ